MVMVLVGANHHDVALDEINRLSEANSGLAIRLLTASDDIRGAVVLSTCNRFEVYLDLDGFHNAIDVTTETVAEVSGLDHDHVVESMRVVVGNSVAQHLFSVASGLESMVVGEDEIAGQVRQALSTAQREHTTTAQLERLMQRALATSKAVAHSTGLGAAGRSIVSVGLDVLEERHGSVAGRRALILGTGSYARVVIAALRRRDCELIQVFSSSGRAEHFALSHEAEAVSLGGLVEALSRADFVIACSGAPHALVDADLILRSRPADAVLPIIDLALSPDVDLGARSLPSTDVTSTSLVSSRLRNTLLPFSRHRTSSCPPSRSSTQPRSDAPLTTLWLRCAHMSWGSSTRSLSAYALVLTTTPRKRSLDP
jgi:glutamyl-tRNA reductase